MKYFNVNLRLDVFLFFLFSAGRNIFVKFFQRHFECNVGFIKNLNNLSKAGRNKTIYQLFNKMFVQRALPSRHKFA